jgi:hypothetical protein
MSTRLSRLAFLAVVCVALAALAQLGPPPPQAFEACKGKRADEVCTVQFMDRTLQGKCAPFEEKLVCVPEGLPRPER